MSTRVTALPETHCWGMFQAIFATVPPPQFCDGWLCFVVSISYVGLVTGFIGDAATLFGCTAGMSKPLTAITVVALGTSLPDTFASMNGDAQSGHPGINRYPKSIFLKNLKCNLIFFEISAN